MGGITTNAKPDSRGATPGNPRPRPTLNGDRPKIDLYFWTTPNGYKPLLFLEETAQPYAIRPVNISAGEQFRPEFLDISPNNRIPAIVDNDPADVGAPLKIFESGAILQYLAEKTGKYLPRDIAERTEIMQWLFWQMGGIGPMLGQHLHFSDYAPEKIDYAIARYANETQRLYGVLDKQLADRAFVAGDYSIADMAIYPWIDRLAPKHLALDEFPNIARWHRDIAMRPAVIRAYDIGKSVNTVPTVTERSKKILLGRAAREAA